MRANLLGKGEAMGQRHKNENWAVNGSSVADAQLCVLMDIRDELQTLNDILRCPNFQDIPRKLDHLSRIRVVLGRLDKRAATKAPLK